MKTTLLLFAILIIAVIGIVTLFVIRLWRAPSLPPIQPSDHHEDPVEVLKISNVDGDKKIDEFEIKRNLKNKEDF